MTLKSKFLIDGVLLKFNIKSEKNSSRAAKLFQTVEKVPICVNDIYNKKFFLQILKKQIFFKLNLQY